MTKQPTYKFTQDQHDFINENGYLHLKSVLSIEHCQSLIKEADDFANGHFTNYLHMHHSPGFRKVHTGQTLCDIGDNIVKRAIPIGSTFFFCKPNNPLENGSYWHQDNYGGRTKFGSYFNLALILDNADVSNGALQIIPKSHKLGDLECIPSKNFSTDSKGNLYNSSPIGNECKLPENLPILQLEYSMGDVIYIHAHTIHRAEKNTHPTKWRRTMYFVYINDGDAFWPGWTAKRELLERYDSDKYIQ